MFSVLGRTEETGQSAFPLASGDTKNMIAPPGLERSVITSQDQSTSAGSSKVPPELSSSHEFPPLVAPSKPQSAAVRPPKDVEVSSTARESTNKFVAPAAPVEAVRALDLTMDGKDDNNIAEKTTKLPEVDQPTGKTHTVDSATDAICEPQGGANLGKEDNGAQGHHPVSMIETSKATDQAVTQVLEEGPQINTGGKHKAESQLSPSAKSEKDASKDATSTSQPSTSATTRSPLTELPTQRPPLLRTIKVVSSTKESKPRPTPLTTVGQIQATPPTVQPSRQASIASLSVPGTPMDAISDNASLTSTSASRPGSPPLGRVGSAPVRQTTKSQQKKERQARKLAEAMTQSEELKSLTEEVVQAPIVPRKKKSKKDPAVKAASASEEPQTLPSTAVEETKIPDVESPVPIKPNQELPKSTKTTKKTAKKSQEIPDESTKLASPTTQTPHQDETVTKTPTTASSIFTELLNSQEVMASALDLFKPVSSFNHRYTVPEQDPNVSSTLPPLTAEQITLLDADDGVIIRATTDPAHPYSYAVVCPDRYVMKNLTKEECERYLKGRKTVISSKGPTVFRSTTYPIEPYLHRRSCGSGSSGGAQTAMSINAEMMERNILPFSTRRAQDDPALMEVLGYGDMLEKKGGAVTQDGAVGEGGERTKGGKVMSIEEAEATMMACRKETEALEKKLNALIRKNRRLIVGNGN